MNMKNSMISKKYWKDQTTPMAKVDLIAQKYGDMINLSLGDPDINTPEPIIEKAFEDAKAGHTKYTDFRGDPELREEVRKFYQEEYGMDLSMEEIFISASASLGMFLALTAILDPNDEVILQAPFFTPYPNQVKLAGGIPIQLPTYEEEDFQIDTKRLRALITERTKALVICSPSNPTGNVLSLETMEEIADIANEFDLVVISDEIYTAYSFQAQFVPFASVKDMRKRTITLNTFSKNFLMTGWRIGNVIAPPAVIDAITQANDNIMFTAPSVSQRAALHALRYRKIVQPPIVEEYRKRMFFAAERINRIPNMSVLMPPKGSFYLFINIKKTGLSSQEVVERILEDAHVLTLQGDAFGECGEGYIRICCTVGIQELEQAFQRMERMELFSSERKENSNEKL